ncbi:MAG: hypothetical protein HY711_11015 [Candidatus Melainabacteria bacterium]|nr:hypothetical protein [Candidatus Melainabacteria bacterium]
MSKSRCLDEVTGHWRDIAASCLTANASEIAEAMPMFTTLSMAVGRPGDLSIAQWAHLYALILQYRPDVIVELGRGYGNSTCVFALAAQKLINTRVLSFCLSDDWEQRTVPAIKDLVDDCFFENLQINNGDFTTVSFNELVKPGQRVLLFWDAHGYQVAEFVLSNVMPVFADNEHLIVMHDITDNRYCGMSKSYGDKPFWSSMDEYYRRGTNFYNISWLTGVVDQAIPVLDFCFRNDITLHSADKDVQEQIDPVTRAKLAEQLPPEIFPQLYHWAYFTLNEATGPYHFPPSVQLATVEPTEVQVLAIHEQPAISSKRSSTATLLEGNSAQTNQTMPAASAIWSQKISEAPSVSSVQEALPASDTISAVTRDLNRDCNSSGSPSLLTRMRIAAKFLLNRYPEQ